MPAIDSPMNVIVPSVGTNCPVRHLKNVLLPAPFGPSKHLNSPSWSIEKLTLLTAVTPPKRIVKPVVRKIS